MSDLRSIGTIASLPVELAEKRPSKVMRLQPHLLREHTASLADEWRCQ